MRPMAVTDDAVAPIRQFQVLPLGNEGVGFRDQRLRQHAAGALSGKLGQRIVDGVRLTERDDSAKLAAVVARYAEAADCAHTAA